MRRTAAAAPAAGAHGHATGGASAAAAGGGAGLSVSGVSRGAAGASATGAGRTTSTTTTGAKARAGATGAAGGPAPAAGAGATGANRTRTTTSGMSASKKEEEVEEVGRRAPGSKPSSWLDKHKVASPFAGSGGKSKTKFGALYDSGDLPCRIDHRGSNFNKLQWDVSVEVANFNLLVPICADGIRETSYPYVFIAREALKDLLTPESASSKIVPVLGETVLGIRAALMESSNLDVFQAALEATRILSKCAGPELNEYLKHLLPQISKKALDTKLRDEVTKTLQDLEENGGPAALKLIKAKVPTYTTIHI